MKLLLDTHTLLWAISGDTHLPQRIVNLIEDSANELYVSMATLWEAAIKISLGKLHVPGQSVDYLIAQIEAKEITVLALTLAHIRAVQTLPPLHRDPFDRMLIAQAQTHSLILLTKDADITLYPVTTIWN